LLWTRSKANGEMVEQAELKYDPVDIQFAQQKTDSRSRGKVEEHENTVSVNMGGRTIYLYNLDDPDNPVELAFQARYGSIVTYRWFGDGYMMIGFSEGYLVVISTHMKEIGEELFSGWFHKDQLDDIAFSPIMQRAATAGGSQIKVIDMTDWKEVKEEATLIDRAQGPIQRLAWTNDGQILTVSTQSGVLYNFLARMPTIHDSHNTRCVWGPGCCCCCGDGHSSSALCKQASVLGLAGSSGLMGHADIFLFSCCCLCVVCFDLISASHTFRPCARSASSTASVTAVSPRFRSASSLPSWRWARSTSPSA